MNSQKDIKNNTTRRNGDFRTIIRKISKKVINM